MCARQVWAQAAGTGEGVWRPDPRDPVDAWLVAAAAVCRTLRRAVEEP